VTCPWKPQARHWSEGVSVTGDSETSVQPGLGPTGSVFT
jgi:hypothetical protein